ncbi:MAG TPA: hypothetical protein PLT35_09535, partial [Vicinamibacterales bacterium]|nr:hypothetical protein [Vicinamibacterales bacterium]
MTSLLHQRITALTSAIRDEGTFELAARRVDVAAVAEAVRELWHRNRAWEVLLDEGRTGITKHGGQLGWMRRWMASTGSVFNGSGRQRGKSLWCFSVLDTYCRQWPGARTRWCGLTIDTARAIVGQAMADYLLTCPEAL